MTRDVLVVGPADRETGGIAQYIGEQTTHLDGIRVHDIAPPRGSGWLWFVRASLRALFDALRFAAVSRPDLVHVHTSNGYSFVRASFYVLYASCVWNRPVILHIHGSGYDEFVRTDSWLLWSYQRLVYGRCCRVIVLSPVWAERLSTIADPDAIETVPNAIEPSAYSPGGADGPPSIVFVSNLIERKGVAEFLDALRELDERAETGYTVDIAGKGPLADEVSSVADDGTVTYHGYVDEATKTELLESGTIFVLPSHAEGLPIAILEAMAAGNAVVSTRVGSIPELIPEDNGTLVEVDDSEAIADALLGLLADRDEAEAMGARNRELVEARYSWERVSAELERIYGECVSGDGADAGGAGVGASVGDRNG